MATAEEDQFDIDIYGDDGNQDFAQEGQPDATGQANDTDTMTDATSGNAPSNTTSKQQDVTMQTQNNHTDNAQSAQPATQQIASTGESGGPNQVQLPRQAPIQQGTKRKEGADDRPTDPGATSALLLQELHWWTTEDDIRGWANQAECEDELKDITFNEHKVNGKSKGQVYVEMSSPQAATALKHKIDSFGEGQQNARKPIVTFNPPHINPYKTLPKDIPNRKDYKQDSRSTSGNFGQNKFNNGGFQGRGGFNNNRGGGGMNNFQSRNFTPPVGMNQGFNNPMPNFNNNMGGNNFGGGNFNRGGGMMGGMRGGAMQHNRGRGGMGAGMMGGMNQMGGMGGMGGMNMGMGGMPMGGNMGMGMGMGGGMGGGFQGNQGHFNPAFFGGQQGGGASDNWNPHGNKRPRPE